MAIRKSQLYSSLWASCDQLRGGMDASQYKDYILTLLFLKYVSDKYAGKPDALIVVPPGTSFADILALRGDKDIGEKLDILIAALAKANDLVGVIDQANFNDPSKLGNGKEMQDRLSKLVGIFGSLDLRANRPEGDDLLGDAYEYLMRHFATESGKSKGQFYTPAEVSRIMAKVVGIGPTTRQDHTIYDPTCGSGSLLLKAADEAPRGITIYGQEKDNATWALAKMNMVLHAYPSAVLWNGNTLSAPYFKDKAGALRTFDFAVANPPFSDKAWSNGVATGEDDTFKRFSGFGTPPTSNGDYAFLLHLLKSLKSDGKGAIIMPHGVLFRGNAEGAIRANLIKRGLITGIIGLPPNLFYGTGIPACIIILDKQNAHTRTGIFMIDASRGFIKDGNKNRLREQDIHRIVDVFTRRVDIPRYSRMVSVSEISSSDNDYNLNLPRYIDSSEPEDLHDLEAHLRGDIPDRDLDALASYWHLFPSLRSALFEPAARPGYSRARTGPSAIRPTILAHPEFAAFAGQVEKLVGQWSAAHRPALLGLVQGASPKALIATISEDLLAGFASLPLLDKYDAYQRLMDYWSDVMQDDVFLVSADGWLASARPRPVLDDKEHNLTETPDLVVQRKKYKLDLLPPSLVVARFFAAEQASVDDLQRKREVAIQAREAFVEEHTGEEGLLEAAKNDDGEITKPGLNERIKQILGDPSSDDERECIVQCLDLIEAESRAARLAREAQAALDAKVLQRYATLTEDEVKSLVVDDKWLLAIRSSLEGEVQRLAQALAGRVSDLEERYANPLAELERDVGAFAAKVDAHLRQMGLAWT